MSGVDTGPELSARRVLLTQDELAQLAVSGSISLSADRLTEVSHDPYAPQTWGSSLRSTVIDDGDTGSLLAGDQVAFPTPAREAVRGESYLVWSNEHRAWWRANSQGYAKSIEDAGVYSRDEAMDIAGTSRNGWTVDHTPDEIPVAVADIPARMRAAIRALPLAGDVNISHEVAS